MARSHPSTVILYKSFLSRSPPAGSIGSSTVSVTAGNLKPGLIGESVFESAVYIYRDNRNTVLDTQ